MNRLSQLNEFAVNRIMDAVVVRVDKESYDPGACWIRAARMIVRSSRNSSESSAVPPSSSQTRSLSHHLLWPTNLGFKLGEPVCRPPKKRTVWFPARRRHQYGDGLNRTGHGP